MAGEPTEETDVRLWSHGVHRQEDAAATKTLRLLEATGNVGLLRPLSADVLLES